jgi:FixJ family two-component response regulator
MKNHGKASNPGVVVIVVSDDLAVRNSLKFWLVQTVDQSAGHFSGVG